MRRLMVGWLLTAALGGYWVVTTGGKKFDGPFRYSGDCRDAAAWYLRAGYKVRTTCQYFED